jgi:hypothetical protein
LNDYLKFAISLRDGATNDTEEQIKMMALEYLHKFDYNTVDAACSLYAKHSIEGVHLGRDQRNINDEETKWIMAFFRILRLPTITEKQLEHLKELQAKSFVTNGAVEAQVLDRLVSRLTLWIEKCNKIRSKKVNRNDIQVLINAADDLNFVAIGTKELKDRLVKFDNALRNLKEALNRANRRNTAKVQLDELKTLFHEVASTRITYNEEEEISSIVQQAQSLKKEMSAILKEDKVSLPAMREMLAKIELFPVNFDAEIDLFQQKMLSAQNWLAKVRKCIPNRRASRRMGPEGEKKMDLEAIRALVVDAPCDDSAEMFEMQDLLECADEWAEKVKKAIENGSEVTLDKLKELMEEGSEMPIKMDEQKYLAAEIDAREWCANAEEALHKRDTLMQLEQILDKAKVIRKTLHPKKQNRWKPQTERDLAAAIDTAKKWVVEVRNVMGGTAFDRMYPFGQAAIKGSNAVLSDTTDEQEKASVATYVELVEKADKIAVNVDAFVNPLKVLLEEANDAQMQAKYVLKAIGYHIPRCATVKNTGGASSDVVMNHAEDKKLMKIVQGKDYMYKMGTGIDFKEKLEQEIKMNSDGTNLTATEVKENEMDASSDFATASALLDRINSFPLTFDEGVALNEIVLRERNWMAQVKDALPPRQSRKKRQSKNLITLAQLENLLEASKQLYFAFPEEKSILSKELEELYTWQERAQNMVTSHATEILGAVSEMKQYDLNILAALENAANATIDSSSHEQPLTNMTIPSNLRPTVGFVDSATTDSSSHVLLSTNMTNPSNLTSTDGFLPKENISIHVQAQPQASSQADFDGVQTTSSPESTLNPSSMKTICSPPTIKRVNIIKHLRLASGCARKSEKEQAEQDRNTSSDDSTDGPGGLLNSLLCRVEEDLAQVMSLENQDLSSSGNSSGSISIVNLSTSSARKRPAVEDLDIADEDESKTVQKLEKWSIEITKLIEESQALLNATTNEHAQLNTILDLIDWLTSARNVFYQEVLPLKDLVAKGKTLKEKVEEMEKCGAFDINTLQMLSSFFYPQDQLSSRLKDLEDWTQSVSELVLDKTANKPTSIQLKLLIEQGNELLLEAEAFKPLVEEIKKAKSWLSKLRKRLKSLVTKKATLISMQVAMSLVEEGENTLRLYLRSFDMLKDELKKATAWEVRVQESGIESGQARIADLLTLLEEYDNTQWLIDLEMHREVLRSATERYCICRQPFDGLMIGCDHCDDWFHDNCIGMSKEKAEKVEHYTCPSCHLVLELDAVLQQQEKQQQQQTLQDHQYDSSISDGMSMNASSVAISLFERQHGMALRKVKREEKAKERAELLLLNCQNHMNQLHRRIEDLKSTARDQYKIANEMIQAAAHAQAQGITVPRFVLPAPPSAPASTSTNPQCNNIAHSNATTILPVSNESTEPSTKGQEPDGSTDLAAAAAGIINMPPDTSGSITTVVLSDNEKKEDIQAITQSLPHSTHLTVAQPSSAANTPRQLLLPAVPSPGAQSVSNTVGMHVSLEMLNQMQLEYNHMETQANELQQNLRVSVERLVSAQGALYQLEVAHHKRQSLMPLAQHWIHQALETINTFSLMYQCRNKLTILLEPGANLLLPAYTEVIAMATEQGFDALDEVKQLIKVLKTISWVLIVVSLLQKRPSREQLQFAMNVALEHRLFDLKALQPLKSVIGRVDIWISKTQKSISKATGTSASKLARVKLLMNEYSKLPLTCSFASIVEEYVHALEDPGSTEGILEQLAQEIVTAATDTLAAAPVAVSSAAKKRKSYSRKEKKIPTSASKKPKTIKTQGNGSKTSTANSARSSPSAASSALDDENQLAEDGDDNTLDELDKSEWKDEQMREVQDKIIQEKPDIPMK